MPFLDHIPSDDVLLRLSAGDDLTTETEDRHFHVMTVRLHRRCEAEATNLPAAELALLRLLSAATSLQLHIGSKQPLQGLFRSDTQRSAAIEDFGEDDARTLLRFAELVRDPALKARLADVALCISRELGLEVWQAGSLAARAYLELASAHVQGGTGIRVVDELCRGLDLAWQFCRRDEELTKGYWSLVQHAIDGSLHSPGPGLALILANEVKRRQKDLAGETAQAFEAGATRYADAGNLYAATLCWDAAHKLWRGMGNREAARRCQSEHGEALVRYAGTMSPLAEAHWLAAGIDVLRRAGNQRARVTELRHRLDAIQLKSLDDLQQHEIDTDVTKLIQRVEEKVVGPTWFDALMQTVYEVVGVPQAEEVRTRVLEHGERFIADSLFGKKILNESGVVVAHEAPFDPNDADSVYGAMVRQCRDVDLRFIADVLLTHATRRLSTEFHAGLPPILQLVSESPMTPPGHEYSLARGLLAGMDEDWLDAAMYLCGQVEPLVRYLFQQRGLSTTALRDDGTQSERSLTELLEMNEAAKVLGPNNVLLLHTLLVHPLGFALRHRWAHGLADDGALANPIVLCVWWFVWRILLLPVLLNQHKHSIEDQPTSEEGRAGL